MIPASGTIRPTRLIAAAMSGRAFPVDSSIVVFGIIIAPRQAFPFSVSRLCLLPRALSERCESLVKMVSIFALSGRGGSKLNRVDFAA